MEESNETTMGDRIKFIRGSLSKIEFSRELGVYRNTLLQWETNNMCKSKKQSLLKGLQKGIGVKLYDTIPGI